MRAALLGGSFNPPHIGHLLAAQFVHATLEVDEVWLLISANHPFGKPLAAFEHRHQMCQLLAAETSGWLKPSTVERDLGGEGRTVDTLEHLKRTRPTDEWVLVIGSDILKDLPKWKDFDRIQTMARVVVLNRAGHPAEGTYGPPLAEVSSTEIRKALETGAEPLGLVPRAVLEYARKHRLYERGERPAGR